MIGLITLEAKCAGTRSAGNPHAACDVAGAGNGITNIPSRARRGKPRIQTRDALLGYRASSRPYHDVVIITNSELHTNIDGVSMQNNVIIIFETEH
jgi:hypothetical protein